MFTDLHIHTLHSDGKLGVKETIDIAHARNIKTLSITDHDSIAGVGEAIGYSKSLGISCISGIELSCRNELSCVAFPQDVSIHILAYNIDYNHEELFNTLNQYHAIRKQILRELLQHLIKNDLDINYEDIYIVAGNQMRIQDVVNHINSCFMSHDKKEQCIAIAEGYYPKLFFQDYSLQRALQLIKNAGGLSVLAHPFFSYRDYDIEQNSFQNVSNLLDCLCDMGLDGIEAFYPTFTIGQSNFLYEEARNRDLFLTAGSDFHGTALRKTMMDFKIEQIAETVSLLNDVNRYSQ